MLIFLLVLRLVGGSAHAMSHEPDTTIDEATSEHCADHAPDTRDDAPEHDEADCCEQAACECPCLHIPCALDVTSTCDVMATRHLDPAHLLGSDHKRPSPLLRPPA